MDKLFYFLLSVAVCTNLIACKSNNSEEVFQYDAKTDVYTNFISNPSILEKQVIKNDNQTIRELLRGMLLSKESPPESAVKAFSQFFAEANDKAKNAHLSHSDNARYANMLGAVIGNLMSLRRHIVAQRRQRFFSGWSNYQEIDKRWLRLFTDIAPIALVQELPNKVIETARTGDVNAFAESLLQSEYVKQYQNKDLVDMLIDMVTDSISADFNGYEQDTGRRVGNDFDASFVLAYDKAMKGLKIN